MMEEIKKEIKKTFYIDEDDMHFEVAEININTLFKILDKYKDKEDKLKHNISFSNNRNTTCFLRFSYMGIIKICRGDRIMLIIKWNYYTREEEFKKLADEYTYLTEDKKDDIIINCSNCYKEDNALNFKSSLVLKNIEGYSLLICDDCLKKELKAREEYKKNRKY